MRKVLLAAMVCVMAICIGCQPSLPEKSECDAHVKSCCGKKACCDKAKSEDKAPEVKDASTISPELKEKAIKRITEIQGTYDEKDGAIVEVDIMNKSFDPADVELIAQLSDVVKLSISSPSVNDQNFALLSKMPKLRQL